MADRRRCRVRTEVDRPDRPLKPAAKFPRQALHSWRIAFRQPRTGRELSIEAPLPADMKALAEAVGLPAVALAKVGLPT